MQFIKNLLNCLRSRFLDTDKELFDQNVKLLQHIGELHDELGGLLFSVGEFERTKKDLNTIICGLMNSFLIEETELTLDFLQELHNKGITVNIFNNTEGNVVVQVVNRPIEEDGL